MVQWPVCGLGLSIWTTEAFSRTRGSSKPNLPRHSPPGFFPVGDTALDILISWIAYLAKDKLFGPDDPLFLASKIINGPLLQFVNGGLDRRSWTNAGPIRKIVKEAFLKSGLPPSIPTASAKL